MAVTAVTTSSEAEGAGLQVGDTVLEINGKTAGQESSQEMARLNPGDTITVKIRARRAGERELKWKVGTRDEISYELRDMENITPKQRTRRAAWLKGEAEVPQAAQPR
jgi:predicted metalloprotease with PDZ domain